MFTLNLKEVDCTPMLPDKVFEAETMFDVENMAADFIEVHHPDAFPNPVTARRKISDAIKNVSGRTLSEQAGYEIDEAMSVAGVSYEAEMEFLRPINEQFKSKKDEAWRAYETERQELVEEMIATEDEAEKEALQLKIDDVDYRNDVLTKTFVDQEYEEIETARAKYREGFKS